MPVLGYSIVAISMLLLPKTPFDGIEIKETTISSLLTAVSIMFGVIFVGFFYFRDKAVEYLRSILNLQRKFERGEFPASGRLADLRKNITEDYLPKTREVLRDYIEFNQNFLPMVFILFCVAIIICIFALIVDSQRFSQFVLLYVVIAVIHFTVGLCAVWDLADRIKS